MADSGDTKNELIVLEDEEIRQQVYFEYLPVEADNLVLKASQLALEVRSSSYARYESVEVVTAVLFMLVPSHWHTMRT